MGIVGRTGLKRTRESPFQRVMPIDSRCIVTCPVRHVEDPGSGCARFPQSLSRRAAESGISTDRHGAFPGSTYRPTDRMGTNQHQKDCGTPERI